MNSINKKDLLSLNKSLLAQLSKKDLILNLQRRNNFSDEPQMTIYNITLKKSDNFSDGEHREINAGGFSFHSKEFALLKCLVEGIERYAMIAYRKKQFKKSSFNRLKSYSLDPSLYINEEKIKQTVFYWSTGIDLLKNQQVLIPAQLIYFSYYSELKEPRLTELVSTGGAGGFEHSFTLLQGIYEIIEKDSFMTTYLIRNQPKKINLDNLKIHSLKKIFQSCERYNLELQLFDITNDLGIPSFLSVLIDRTGLGPRMTFGLKSSINYETAIEGSIEESFHTRPWIRLELMSMEDQYRPTRKNLRSFKDRALFWLSPAIQKELKFILDQGPTDLIYRKPVELSTEEELQTILGVFKSKNIPIYYSDITPEFFSEVGGFIYKCIAPTLQPIYFNETKPFIKIQRLKEVSQYFGASKFKLNAVPHPFL